MFERWEIYFDTVAPSYDPIFESPEWRYLGIGSVTSILLWTGQYPSTAQTCAWMFIHKIFFSHDIWFFFPQVPTHY